MKAPNQLNYLTPNGYQLVISKASEVSYFCQEVNVPNVNLGQASQPTRYIDYPIPGDKLTFGSFSASFLVDANLSNYMTIYNWMIGLGFPENTSQFSDLMAANSGRNPQMKSTSDIAVSLLNSSYTPIKTFTLTDAFPISLSGFQLATTSENVQYVSCTVDFAFSLYKYVD